MSGLILRHLDNAREGQPLLLDFPSAVVHKALEYAAKHDFERTLNPIQHPLVCNQIEDNVGVYDREYIEGLKDDFPALLVLYKAAKTMDMECLKQLVAAAIASFFRRRCYEDVKNELGF